MPAAGERAMRAIAAAMIMAFSLPVEAKVPDARRVETLARQAMTKTPPCGLPIAVIQNGRIPFVQAFGERNAKGEPLTTDTIMYGASLTKAVFAYTVMQLVEEGRVDLD